MTSKSLLRTILAWFVAAIFLFPIYFWVTVSIKKDKDIFAIPPKLISFEPSFKAYEEVLGISSFLYVKEMTELKLALKLIFFLVVSIIFLFALLYPPIFF